MQHFSTPPDNAHFTWTRRQDDFHSGRLLCWSSALVALTLWGTAQFFNGQNSRWHNPSQHVQSTFWSDDLELPPPAEVTANLRQVAAKLARNR
jgi:hypothetical protein